MDTADRLAAGTVRCAVCDGMSDAVVWRENGYEGRACVCGTVYTTPEPPFGAVDPTHDAHPASFYSLPANLKARWVQKSVLRGRLLEIGCGEGYFLAAARSLGFEVTGVEPHPDRARQVAERLGIKVACACLEELDLPGRTFDVVYHCDLLSHFPDPVGALQKMRSLLTPGGILAFEVGILGGVSPSWYRVIGTLGYPDHRWFYSERSLRSLLERAGLRVERRTHFGLLPSAIVQGTRTILRQGARKMVRRKSAPQLPGPSGTAQMQGRAPSAFGRLNARLDNFARYGMGRVAPRVGPSTLFLVARPVRSGKEN